MGTWSPEFFQQIMAPFVANGGWFGVIFDLAGPIFWMMSTIALGWVLIEGFINRDAAGLASGLGITLIGIGTGWVLFMNAAPVGYAIYNTLSQLGAEVGGLPLSALAPDGLMVLGYDIAQTIWTAVGFGTWFTEPVMAIVLLAIGLAIFLLYLWMAIQLMYVIIEAFFAIVGGSIFIPFGAFVWTRQLLATWLSWILGVSFQLFFTYLVMSQGLILAQGFLADIQANTGFITSNLVVPATALAQTLVFWSLLVVIPKMARRKIDAGVGIAPGSGSMTGVLGAALASGGAIAGAAAAGAAALGQVGSTHSAQLLSSQASFSQMMTSP